MSIASVCLVLASLLVASLNPAPQEAADTADNLEAELVTPVPGVSTIDNANAQGHLRKFGLDTDVPAKEFPGTFYLPTGHIPVRFPDGTAITVAFRLLPPVQAIDSEFLTTGHFESKRKAAAGDGDAAYRLYLAASQCSKFGDTEPPEPWGSFCHHFRTSDSGPTHWLEISAAADNIHAIKELGVGADTSPEEASTFHLRAWRLGHIPALAQMADDPRLAGDSATEKGPQSQVVRFAMIWLQAELQNLASGNGRREYVRQLAARSDALREGLTSIQVDEAMRVAESLLRENPNCCFGP